MLFRLFEESLFDPRHLTSRALPETLYRRKHEHKLVSCQQSTGALEFQTVLNTNLTSTRNKILPLTDEVLSSGSIAPPPSAYMFAEPLGARKCGNKLNSGSVPANKVDMPTVITRHPHGTP